MAAGHEEAVEIFHGEYFDWLYAQARRVSGRDEAFCLDVVQDALIRIVRCIKPVRNEAQLRAWLGLVVQTAVYDRLRSDLRWHGRHEDLPAPAERPADDDEKLAWLREEIGRLDPKLARMVEWRYHHGWTLRRIGERLGLTAGAVDGRLRRLVKTLRQKAEEES